MARDLQRRDEYDTIGAARARDGTRALDASSSPSRPSGHRCAPMAALDLPALAELASATDPELQAGGATLEQRLRTAARAVVIWSADGPVAFGFGELHGAEHRVDLVVGPVEGRRRLARELVRALLAGDAQHPPEEPARHATFAVAPEDADVRAALGALGAREFAVVADYAGLGIRRIVLTLPAERWPTAAEAPPRLPLRRIA